MVLPWLIATVGAGLIIAGLLIRRSLRPRQDRIVRTGGYSVDQIRVVRRAIIRGRFPDDPELHDVTVAYARQGANNLPLGFRTTPVIFVGIVLAASGFYAFPGQALFGITFQVLYTLLAIFMIAQNARALSGCRRVIRLDESSLWAEAVPE